ncbi:unnamed protein product, partial [Rotaria magnacalcarata]
MEEIDNPESIDILFRIFPSTKNLEIEHIININIEIVLREFLKAIQFRALHFRSLTFHVPVVNDEIIGKFNYMIHSENLVLNYAIEHS